MAKWSKKGRLGWAGVDLSDACSAYSGALKVGLEYPSLFRMTFSQFELYMVAGTLRITENATLSGYYNNSTRILCGLQIDRSVFKTSNHWQTTRTQVFVESSGLSSSSVQRMFIQMIQAGTVADGTTYRYNGFNVTLDLASPIEVHASESLSFSTWWRHSL